MLNKQAALVLGLVGVALAVLGVIVGVMPVRADGYDCGSAFAESDRLAVDEFSDTLRGGTGENDCDAARGDRQVFTWGPIAVGAFLAFGAFALSQVPAKTPVRSS